MKVLIISGSFYPINTPRAFRTTELAKRFCKLGHDVTVYIPKIDYDLSEFVKQYPINIQHYDRKTMTPTGREGIIKRIWIRLLVQFLEYPAISLMRTLPKALKNEVGYDLLITVAAPHPIHWAVGKMYSKGKRLAKTWIADCGDPYYFGGTTKYKHPFYFALQEKRWCRECDYITVPVDTAVKGYFPEFKSKIKVIPQAFDFDEVKLLEYVPHKVPTFAFTGNLIPEARDPRPFLDYLSTLNIEFKFILYASKTHLVEPYKKRFGDQIEIHDFIPRLELLQKLSTMDFLVDFVLVSKNQRSSKLIDYTLTKRPILSINTLEMDKTMVDEFLRGDYSRQLILPDIDNYNIVNVVDRIINLCRKDS